MINYKQFKTLKNKDKFKLINSYRYHDKKTGYLEFIPNTPESIKELYEKWINDDE